MKQAIIRSIGNGNWLVTGTNFDVTQFSRVGCVMNVTELINFANLNRVNIVNKNSLTDSNKLIY